jgi:hypothetical protein
MKRGVKVKQSDHTLTKDFGTDFWSTDKEHESRSKLICSLTWDTERFSYIDWDEKHILSKS